MKPLEYINYFRKIAEKLLDIEHVEGEKKRFTSWNIGEVLTGKYSELNLNEYCLILIRPEGRFQETNTDQRQHIISGAFMIVRNAEHGNFREIDQIYSETYELGREVIGKIDADMQSHFSGDCPQFVEGFDMSSVKYYAVEKIFDNAHGTTFEFEFLLHDFFKPNPDLWL